MEDSENSLLKPVSECDDEEENSKEKMLFWLESSFSTNQESIPSFVRERANHHKTTKYMFSKT
jgi:hypothetical protein